MRLAADVIGAVCWLDCALTDFTVGEWSIAPGLYGVYAAVLSASVGTRQVEKWTDPGDRDSRSGALFVGAWLLLTAAIIVYRQLGSYAIWPENLSFAVGTVLAVYVGSKVSVGLRDQKIKEGWGSPPPRPRPQPPDPETPQPGKPRTGPEEPGTQPGGPEPGPEPDPTEPEVPPYAPSRPVDPSKVDPVAARACKQLGLFRTEDAAAALGWEFKPTAGAIGVLVRAGLVRNEGHGWFRWVGD